MASLVALSCGCMDSLKSILTSQDFGSEYEILCTELSVQWLRIRLWGQSVGLHIDGAHHLQRSILSRPEIETTVTQAVNSIAFLLAEIEVLRRRYELRPRLIPESPEDEKARRDSKSHSGLFRPAKHLHQRMRDNQKQKSFLALAKWAVCDAKRFHEKVSSLKTLIDGLEDISKAAGINQFQSSPQSLTNQIPVSPNENPPPYSVEPPQQVRPMQARIEQSSSQNPVVDPVATRQSPIQDPELFQQYISLKKYAASLQTIAPTRLRACEMLSTLLDGQFKELRVDVYDELCRRRQTGTPPPFLPPIHTYHVKRNMARERLSTLPWYRFAHLVTDVVFDLERRFSTLENGTESVSQPIIAPDVLTRTFSRRNPRYGGVVSPPVSPPALLSERASHPATLNGTNITTEWPLQSSQQCRTSATLDLASGTISSALNIENSHVVAPTASLRSFPTFKSFRVSMDDPTYKVLPAVMKKYGIDAPWDQYSLYINCGTSERRLELDEKPLVLFKALEQAGHKPCFMLRKFPATIKEGIIVR